MGLSDYGQTANAQIERQEPPVLAALQSTYRELDELSGTIGDLEAKLALVLRPVQDKATNGANGATSPQPPATSALVEHIQDQAARVRTLTVRLYRLIGHLDI